MGFNSSLNWTFVEETKEDAGDDKPMTSFLSYQIGEAISRFYFPVLVPVGLVGNILSFLVMVQRHNRRKSFSLYVAALAVSDSIQLILAFLAFLRQVPEVRPLVEPPWMCLFINYVTFSGTGCSTLLVVSMTFERFYSIVRPHKAASFNTVKRARVIISCVIMIVLLSNIPHVFISDTYEGVCLPYNGEGGLIAMYFYVHNSFYFFIPFISLLSMNTVIIHTLCKRTQQMLKMSTIQGRGQSQGQSQGQSEHHIYVTLLLVTFGFLLLITPGFSMLLYIQVFPAGSNPQVEANYSLFYQVGQKMYFTNSGINFFLYVLSGNKFRTDLKKLFRCLKSPPPGAETSIGTSVSTVPE